MVHNQKPFMFFFVFLLLFFVTIVYLVPNASRNVSMSKTGYIQSAAVSIFFSEYWPLRHLPRPFWPLCQRPARCRPGAAATRSGLRAHWRASRYPPRLATRIRRHCLDSTPPLATKDRTATGDGGSSTASSLEQSFPLRRSEVNQRDNQLLHGWFISTHRGYGDRRRIGPAHLNTCATCSWNGIQFKLNKII